jgi:hypothetical protein
LNWPPTFWQRFAGRTERERKRRRKLVGNILSWSVIGAIAAFVLLLVGQFITHTWFSPPVSSEHEKSDMLVRKGQRIQLMVLNGSGQADLARRFTDFLRARKFDVVEMSNYSRSDVEQSFIIDKIRDSSAAQKVAYALGVDPAKITLQVDSNAFVDAAIVIGKDFLSLKPMKEGPHY